MSRIKTRTVGRTGVEVTEMGFGGAPLGDLFEAVSESQSQDTLQAAWDAGIRYFDTSPFYGYGKRLWPFIFVPLKQGLLRHSLLLKSL